jgi:preprotein translocase subunit Sss1
MASASLPRRLAWFIALWAAGVLAVGLVGYAIKLALGA